MKSDFVLAITQLSAEKNLPREVVLGAVEAALESAYRRDNFAPNQEISVKIDPASGKVQVWAEKTVVEQPQDIRCEIALDAAQKMVPGASPPRQLSRLSCNGFMRQSTAPYMRSLPIKKGISSPG